MGKISVVAKVIEDCRMCGCCRRFNAADAKIGYVLICTMSNRVITAGDHLAHGDQIAREVDIPRWCERARATPGQARAGISPSTDTDTEYLPF